MSEHVSPLDSRVPIAFSPRTVAWSIGHATVWAFLLFAFFPYISLVPLPTDTQPFALAIAAVIVAPAVDRSMPPELAVLFFPFAAAIPVLLASGVDMVGLRSMANYASMCFIPFATYLILRHGEHLFLRFLEASVYIWFATGFVQTMLWRGFLTFLLPSARTSSSRGVVGLAPEPTHYAIQCLFLLLITYLAFPRPKRDVLLLLLLVQIVFFARSTMAVLVLLIFVAGYLAVHFYSPRRLLYVVLAVGGLIGLHQVLAWAQLFSLSETRLWQLGTLFLENPSYIFLRDASGNQRLSAILFSLAGFIDNGSLPGGFGTFPEYVAVAAPRFSDFIFNAAAGDRIMSAYGAAFYEIGFPALAVPAVITSLLWRAFDNRRDFFVFCGTLHMLLFTAIPLANPIIGVALGYAAHLGLRHGAMVRADPVQEEAVA